MNPSPTVTPRTWLWWFWLLAGLALTVIIALIDSVTVPELFFTPFYLLPISLITWRAGAIAGTMVSLASVVAWSLVGEFQQIHYTNQWVPLLNQGMRFGVYLIVVLLLAALKAAGGKLEEKVRTRTVELTAEIAERKAAELALERSNEEMRSLAARIQSIREEERTRIAREVHDQVGQALSVLNLDLMWVQGRSRTGTDAGPTPQLQDRFKSMLALVEDTSRSVQHICEELRPGVLDDLGLVAAIDWQAQEFKARTGIDYHLTSEPRNIDLDKDRATAAFRIFQEILTNVLRHAKASHVHIQLRQASGEMTMEVTDNGKGIPPDEMAKPKSYGILGMRERSLLLGGKFDIGNGPTGGTRVRVSFPLHQPESAFKA